MRSPELVSVMHEGEWRDWFEIVPKCARCHVPLVNPHAKLCKHCQCAVRTKRSMNQ